MAGLVDLHARERAGLPMRHDDVTGKTPILEDRLDGARHRYARLAGTDDDDAIDVRQVYALAAGLQDPAGERQVLAHGHLGVDGCEGSVDDGASVPA